MVTIFNRHMQYTYMKLYPATYYLTNRIRVTSKENLLTKTYTRKKQMAIQIMVQTELNI